MSLTLIITDNKTNTDDNDTWCTCVDKKKRKEKKHPSPSMGLPKRYPLELSSAITTKLHVQGTKYHILLYFKTMIFGDSEVFFPVAFTLRGAHDNSSVIMTLQFVTNLGMILCLLFPLGKIESVLFEGKCTLLKLNTKM
jgi:hypothetical protein